MKIDCNWAVVAKCQAKNNGVWEPFEKIVAAFQYPFNADDFIGKCLPQENRECFYIKYLPDLYKEREETAARTDGKREATSKARAEGVCDYRLWTAEELISGYSWEMKRINQDDAKSTKKLIREELKRRFNATLKLLDDEQTKENPLGTYKYLLNVTDHK